MDRLEGDLEPSRSLITDNAALVVLYLEERLVNSLGYTIQTRGALSRIDKELQPGEETQMDLESVMTWLNEVPARVKAWKNQLLGVVLMWHCCSSMFLARTWMMRS